MHIVKLNTGYEVASSQLDVFCSEYDIITAGSEIIRLKWFFRNKGQSTCTC